MKIGFIGAGKVGFSLGKYFSENCIELSGYFDVNSTDSIEAAKFTNSKVYESLEEVITNSSFIFITTPDYAIESTFNKIKNFNIKDKFICHCSGSLSSNSLKDINNFGAFGYSVHPMYAFSNKYSSYKHLKSAYFSIEGNTNYIHIIKSFFEGLGNKTLILSSEQKSLYHLSNVTVSNLVLSLLEIGSSYLENFGLTKNEALSALFPLIENNISNIKNSDFLDSLTGPIERNDLDTILKHLSVIPSNDKVLYKRLSSNLVKIAKEKHPSRDYSEIDLITS